MRFAGLPGETVMDVALDNNVPGIVAQCGGGCTCCTCHVWVLAPPLSELPRPHRDETEMLEYAWGHNATSRLSCQVTLTEDTPELIVRIPAQQA